MDEKGLGKTLQEARQKAGLTQQQLCHQANLSFSTLTKIERGAIKSPSIFTVQSIAGALGVGLDELIGVPSPGGMARTLHKTQSALACIYFDVNGCLVHFYQRAFTKLAEDTGARSDVVETAFWRLNDDANRGTLSMQRFQCRTRRSGSELALLIGSNITWISLSRSLKCRRCWSGRSALQDRTVNKYHARLAECHAPKQKGTRPANYDAIIDSSEVGTIKPETQDL